MLRTQGKYRDFIRELSSSVLQAIRASDPLFDGMNKTDFSDKILTLPWRDNASGFFDRARNEKDRYC
ncbi:MAG: hypothetical protein A3J37_03200 [Alphaproteobacteria bacterium RIFCSPHIGHO2_12_FULL_45_9]|nr:MAG: hypothetical protein A3B66_00695 [Alphaproteobacteria bacterium RIFCSPHIGHO2_02_FULL_46_13]OFW99682.1 MAG: hypothetical protein A3J37_03200 [Alphaproteobacteria bacterium RIFCSPHIGHO2_12_FULL_45_9]